MPALMLALGIFMTQLRLNLADLKAQSPKDLLSLAEELEVENASTMRKGDMMFAILKERADEEWVIGGDGVLEVLQDGFGFLRSPEANYLPGPDDIYVSPDMIRQHSMRTGDTVEGVMKEPNDTERYFALTAVEKINFEDPAKAKHKVAFENLTPLYPDERLTMETDDPTVKDRSARIIDLVSPIGKGQRSLIVAPPRTGKTVLLQNIAKSISGKVSRINDNVDPNTQMVNIYITVSGNDLWEGMYLKGDIYSSTFVTAAEIPRRIITNKNTVFVIADSVAAEQKIEIISLSGDTAVVTGLRDSSKVITKSQNIYDGQKVNIL